MRTLAVILLAVWTGPVLAAEVEPTGQPIMPLDEVRPGMVGIGRTTLEGTEIIEFQVVVRAILRNLDPKRDLILVRCRGAGLEESGVISGMSGSPVTIDGRLIGAVAFSFPWAKLPIAGVQPIEQMLEVTDEHARSEPEPPVVARGPASHTVPLETLGLAELPPEAAGRTSFDLQPIRTPVTVSGAGPRTLARLRRELEPRGMVAVQGGAADAAEAPHARLAPGAPIGVVLMRGDMEMAAMGTITDVRGDRVYGFGHSMFGLGPADYPMTTGVAHLVIPSLASSFRLGAPAEEVGRLTRDEETAILGRLGPARARMVPVEVGVAGPDEGAERQYRYEIIDHRSFSALLASIAAMSSLESRRALPVDHTVTYRIRVEPVGLAPITYENVAVSPSGSLALVDRIRTAVGLLMNNPFENRKIARVEVEAEVEAESRLAEILEARLLENAARPGSTVQAQVRIQPYRQEPRWLTVPVEVPADYPDGTYGLVISGAAEAARQEMSNHPARFRIRNLADLVRVLGFEKRQDRLYIRLDAPGEGIAIGTDELPNLPPSMRRILSGSARADVLSVRQARETIRAVPWVLVGGANLQLLVDRHAPRP